jgi:membrane protein involved in colicin uptake
MNYPANAGLDAAATDVGKRISFGQQGLTGTDRLAQITQALQESDPESEVKVTPSGVQVGPPPMKGATPQKGRFKAALQTGLSALSHADPAMLDNHPLYMLGQGIGGAIGGAVSPRTGAKVQRYNQILDAQTDEMRGLKVAGEEAKVGGLQAEARYRELEPAIENAKLELERQRNQGVIDQHEYDRQKDVLDRASREKTNATTAAATIEAAKIRANAGAGGGLTAYQKQETAEKDAKREADRQAAQDEYDQLTRDEAEAGQKKNDAYAALEKFRSEHKTGNADTDHVMAQMTQEAENANKTYQSFAEKKRDALTKVRQNQRPAAATGATGPTLQGAIDAFKASNKRDPNDKELANIKKHYGF